MIDPEFVAYIHNCMLYMYKHDSLRSSHCNMLCYMYSDTIGTDESVLNRSRDVLLIIHEWSLEINSTAILYMKKG